MANNVKKVIVANKDLPAIQPTGDYAIRFRIVSKDGTKVSAWSVPQTIVVPVSKTILDVSKGSITSDNVGINIGWNANDLATKTSFDVYLAWTYPDGSDIVYTHANTVNANTYYAIIPSNDSGKAINVNVIVQQETPQKTDLTTSATNPAANPILIFAGTGSTTASILGLPTSFDGGVVV
ncbi:hypothetical protein UFOVP222_48 [uncultured Caudovirales phage]|uniref:Uncharacterized protein n=1 Tax=uncultured Caudovirales phage TaxID=2100421 RepID=A0A6J5TBX7_9CAUD|nr:hypothetical protein UFOVP108_43 [uncultured Caudovirales phage]CAB5219275.1 hypothetical protein UFOVP222_48 [uncultured Caudovirales phage]